MARVRVNILINDSVEHRFVLIDRRFDGVQSSELNETFFKVIAFPENNTRCQYIGINIIAARRKKEKAMPTTIDINTLLDISHEIYRFANVVILDAANQEMTIEGKARELMPLRFSHEFFACLGRCRTKKSRIKELKLLAGICHAMAYELTLETQEKEGEGE